MQNASLRKTPNHCIILISLLFIALVSYGLSDLAFATGTETNNQCGNEIFLGSLGNSVPCWVLTLASVVVTGGIGYGFADYAISRYQRRKDESDIRRGVLNDFQASFKDYVVLMDTFVARIVIANSTFEKTDDELSDLLPYGYRDFEKDSKKDFRAKDVHGYFKFSQDVKLSDKFSKEFEAFEESFFTKRIEVTRFLSGLRLFYKNGEKLNENFDEVWTRIMANHTLLLKLIKSSDQKEFIKLLNAYNESADVLFDDIRYYDYELAKQKMKVGRRKNNPLNNRERVKQMQSYS